MKLKPIIFAAFLFVATFSVAMADTPIRGTLYGQNFGLIHTNYTTSVSPFSACDVTSCNAANTLAACTTLAPTCTWSAALATCNLNVNGPLCPSGTGWDKYHVGARNNFYISPADLYYAYPSGGDPNFSASIENIIDCDPDVGCALHGFMWSDTIGWTILDGEVIQSDVTNACTGLSLDACNSASYACQYNIGTSTCQNSRPFTPKMRGRVNFAGIFDGFIWNKNAGWIQLSECANKNETECNADSLCEWDTEGVCKVRASTTIADLNQNTNWGIYVDLDEAEASPLQRETTECSTALTELDCDAANPLICSWNDTTTTCDTLTIELGRPLHGFAWSEHLGWISFGDDPEYGAFTSWVPDTTPPAVAALTQGERWFANDNAAGTISWEDFAVDPESGINDLTSTLAIAPDPDPKFLGCPGTEVAPATPLDIAALTFLIPDPVAKSADLSVGTLGQFDTAGTNNLGYCKYKITGTIVNGAGLSTVINPSSPVIFYVRAGDLDEVLSSLPLKSPLPTAVADGRDRIEYWLLPKDVSGNRIVPVKAYKGAITYLDDTNDSHVNEWVRNVTTVAHFDIADFHYNQIEDPFVTSFYKPIRISDFGIGTTGLGAEYTEPSTAIVFPNGYTLSPSATFGSSIEVAGFAPTKAGLPVRLATISLWDDTTEDLVSNPLETVINSLTPFASVNPFKDSGTIAMIFNSAVDVLPGSVSTDPLVPGVPVTATYKVNNNSTLASIDNVSIDHLFKLKNTSTGNVGWQAMDFRNIKALSPTPGAPSLDSVARYEGVNYMMGDYLAKYELFRGSPGLTDDKDVSDGSDTVFHSDTFERYLAVGNPTTRNYMKTYPDPVNFSQIPSTVDSFGEYQVTNQVDGGDGTAYVPVDRSDYLTGFNLNSGASQDMSVQFEIGTLTGTFDQTVAFDMDQYIAYRAPDPSDNLTTPNLDGMFEFAVLEEPGVITGVEVKNVGLQTTGNIKGENVFETVGGREYEVVSGSGAAELQKTMRSNAAELSRNVAPCDIADLYELPTSEDCVKKVNNSLVAVYDGTDQETLELGDGLQNIVIPSGGYTLIVRGGANIAIASNIVRNATSGSFGIIVLSDGHEDSANVFVRPNVTNVTGLLYSEGSILSQSDTGAYYYGPGAASTTELKNQLFWKGSIISRNSIGGAPSNTIPSGISDCDNFVSGITVAQCAQLLDLDYVRRFIVSTAYDALNAVLGGYTPFGVKFAGGGTCVGQTGGCAITTQADSTITIKANGYIDLSPTASRLDPFFVEQDNLPPPPGFTAGGGFTSSREIR